MTMLRVITSKAAAFHHSPRASACTKMNNARAIPAIQTAIATRLNVANDEMSSGVRSSLNQARIRRESHQVQASWTSEHAVTTTKTTMTTIGSTVTSPVVLRLDAALHSNAIS